MKKFPLALTLMLGSLALYETAIRVSAQEAYEIQAGDPQMKAAHLRAQKELPKFIWALKHPSPSRKYVSLKAQFDAGERSEYMWLDQVSYNGKVFQGTLVSHPVYVKTFKNGDRVELTPSRVVDWMWVENGKLVGGYTQRVFRNRLTTKDRLEYDKRWPYKFQ